MEFDKNIQAFWAIVKAGFWEEDIMLLPYGEIDYTAIYNMAEKQRVLGLVAAGLDHVSDTKIPQVTALTFAGSTLQMEQRNKMMSLFTVDVFQKMNKEGLHPLLVKGQGLAQCYERPQWRSSGDIDFFFSKPLY